MRVHGSIKEPRAKTALYEKALNDRSSSGGPLGTLGWGVFDALLVFFLALLQSRLKGFGRRLAGSKLYEFMGTTTFKMKL